jgi:hypothetical protein
MRKCKQSVQHVFGAIKSVPWIAAVSSARIVNNITGDGAWGLGLDWSGETATILVAEELYLDFPIFLEYFR